MFLSERRHKEIEQRLREQMAQREKELRAEIDREIRQAREVNIKEMEKKREDQIRTLTHYYHEMVEKRVKEATRLQEEGFFEEATKLNNQIKELKARNEKTQEPKCTIM